MTAILLNTICLFVIIGLEITTKLCVEFAKLYFYSAKKNFFYSSLFNLDCYEAVMSG